MYTQLSVTELSLLIMRRIFYFSYGKHNVWLGSLNLLRMLRRNLRLKPATFPLACLCLTLEGSSLSQECTDIAEKVIRSLSVS